MQLRLQASAIALKQRQTVLNIRSTEAQRTNRKSSFVKESLSSLVYKYEKYNYRDNIKCCSSMYLMITFGSNNLTLLDNYSKLIFLYQIWTQQTMSLCTLDNNMLYHRDACGHNQQHCNVIHAVLNSKKNIISMIPIITNDTK